jgi:hypothetical protein
MPHPEIELQRERLFIERLYKQLQMVEEFRFKFTITKITFVIGLLGIGTIRLKTSQDIELFPALLLAPLVAVLFDMLGITSTLAICRINTFLRDKKPCEREWQEFIKKRPLSFSRQDLTLCLAPGKKDLKEFPLSFYFWAANGFTFITFLASIVALLYVRPDCEKVLVSLILFVFIFFLWVFSRCLECKAKTALEK